MRLLKQERIKDYLLMEEEFIRNQERLKPQEEKNEEERSKVDKLSEVINAQILSKQAKINFRWTT